MKRKSIMIAGSVAGGLVLTAAGVAGAIFYPKPKKSGIGRTEIAFVGDSITYGQGALPNRNNAFAALVPGMLGSDYSSVNYGLGGRTLCSNGSWPYFREKNAKLFWASRPDIVVFMLGTNDTSEKNWDRETFEKEYHEAVLRMICMPSVREVYVMIPPAIFINDPKRYEDNNTILEQETIPAICRAIEGLPVTVIDLNSLTQGHREWFADDLHPNKLGNRMIAEHIAEVMKGH